jgi:SAM-dependent methyltransferase
MDPATTEFYKRYAEQGAIGAEAPESAISRYFESAFEAGSKVLDIGSGSGRDLALLRAKGFDAYGIEPNDAMRAYALQEHPDLLTRLQAGSLPLSGTPFGGVFDGVVCSAVMMHIPEDQFREAWESICRVLKPDGRVLFSLPQMRSDLLAHDRDRDGRFFRNHPPAVVDALLKAMGFSRIDLGGAATSAYADVTWSISLFGRDQALGATTTGM